MIKAFWGWLKSIPWYFWVALDLGMAALNFAQGDKLFGFLWLALAAWTAASEAWSRNQPEPAPVDLKKTEGE